MTRGLAGGESRRTGTGSKSNLKPSLSNLTRQLCIGIHSKKFTKGGTTTLSRPEDDGDYFFNEKGEKIPIKPKPLYPERDQDRRGPMIEGDASQSSK
jgi:hypothetical protein